MRQRSWAAFWLTLAVIAGGCGSQPDEAATPDATESPAAEAPAEGEEAPEAQPFESPVVEEDPPMASAPSGLTSSTNPQERTRQIQRNLDNRREGNDPFGILPVDVARSEREGQAVAQGAAGATTGTDADGDGVADGDGDGEEAVASAGPPLPPLTAQNVESLPDSEPSDFIVPSFERPIAELPPIEPQNVDSVPDTAPDDFLIPSFELPPGVEPLAPLSPPPPDTALADATEITGVVQIGGEVQIIVSTPDMSAGRYVRIGDTIANGQVRILRVERLSGNPVVILEQNGVEVARGVGEPAIIPEEEGEGEMVNLAGM